MIINKRESAYFFIGMLNRVYVQYNLHNIKKKEMLFLLLIIKDFLLLYNIYKYL